MHSIGFFKGMATGVVVGAAVAMLTDPITDRQRRRFKKKTEGAFRRVGCAMDAAMDIFH